MTERVSSEGRREKVSFCRRGTNGMKIVRFLIEENERVT